MAHRLPIICPPESGFDETPWTVPETLTLFEAALAYCDAHPHHRFLSDLDPIGSADRFKALLFFGLLSDDDPRHRPPNLPARDVYFELIELVAQGQIEPIERAWLSPGKPDPFRTRIALSHLVDMARRRGDGGRAMRSLMRWYRVSNAPAPRSPTTKRRTGPKPRKRDQVATEMRADLLAKVFTSEQLDQMKLAALSAQYHGYSSQTVNDARNEVLGSDPWKLRKSPNTEK